jgi:gluconokinase
VHPPCCGGVLEFLVFDWKNCIAGEHAIYCRMSTYPKSPKETTKGMMYFPRMLDKIRLHARGELHEDYHSNLGAPRTLDGACCNFLRINYADLRERVLQGGNDGDILEWCFENGRRLNEGDLFVWNGFASKLGWRDSFATRLEERKKEHGITDRTDILTIPDLMDFDEGRFAEATKPA